MSCDNVITVPFDDLDDVPAGHLEEIIRARLGQALRYALDIVYSAWLGPRFPSCRFA